MPATRKRKKKKKEKKKKMNKKNKKREADILVAPQESSPCESESTLKLLLPVFPALLLPRPPVVPGEVETGVPLLREELPTVKWRRPRSEVVAPVVSVAPSVADGRENVRLLLGASSPGSSERRGKISPSDALMHAREGNGE